LEMEFLGATLDDAAGEAFDKVAKMLQLPYPGGPLVDKHAAKGNPEKYTFPIPDIKDLDFSFSGIKTAVLYFLQKEQKADPDFAKNNMDDICASVQYTIITALMKKLQKAAKTRNINQIGIAGGVSANSGLRKALEEYGKKNKWNVYLPKFEYCTDNAAMIGITAYYKLLKGEFTDMAAVPSARTQF